MTHGSVDLHRETKERYSEIIYAVSLGYEHQTALDCQDQMC